MKRFKASNAFRFSTISPFALEASGDVKEELDGDSTSGAVSLSFETAVFDCSLILQHDSMRLSREAISRSNPSVSRCEACASNSKIIFRKIKSKFYFELQSALDKANRRSQKRCE